MDIEDITKYAVELTDQIRHLTSFKEKLDELTISVRQIASKQNKDLAREVHLLREEVDTLTNHLMLKGMPGINRYEIEIQRLKGMINSDDWPEAVPEEMIPKTDEDKQNRAETVLDILVTEFLEGVRFLDMGCGEGYMAINAVKRGAKMTVGFDIEPTWKFNEKDNLAFTSNPERLKNLAPFDIILLYDVIDHIQHIDPCHMMQGLKQLLSPSGKIYIRAHPWCSRHGGHLYDKLNKAYIHMLFDDMELLRLFDINPEFVLKLTHPLETYKKWFKGAGLIIQDEVITTKKVDELFQDLPPVIKNRLEGSHVDLSNMSIEYVDFILEVNQSNQQIF